jgi:hypothetical protein
MDNKEKRPLLVKTGELRDALKRMKSLGGNAPGNAIFVMRPGELVVEWGGMSEGLEAEGDGFITLSLPGELLRGLDWALPRTDRTKVAYSDGWIQFGALAVKCEVLEQRPPVLLPMNASALEVLLLPYRASKDNIRDSGLMEKLEEVRERKMKSVDTASRALGWLHITPEILGRWVDAHLAAKAAKEQTF